MLHIEVHHCKDRHQQKRKEKVRHDAVLQPRRHHVLLVTCKVLSHKRSEREREAGSEDDERIEHIVHERRSREFRSAVLAHHNRVGKACDDTSKLSHDDRKGKLEK